MTMDYTVKDPSLLALVKAGDKVKFTVEDVGGTYTIVALRAGALIARPDSKPLGDGLDAFESRSEARNCFPVLPEFSVR
jgi:hypothetical protein